VPSAEADDTPRLASFVCSIDLPDGQRSIGKLYRCPPIRGGRRKKSHARKNECSQGDAKLIPLSSPLAKNISLLFFRT
jgi:hypothetical protein